MEDLAYQDPSSVRRGRRNLKPIIILSVISVLLLVLIFSVIKALSSQNPSSTQSPVQTSSPIQTPTPAPTTTPQATSGATLNRSDLSVRVENGSGGSGVASKGSAFLKNLGYSIASSGNADNFNYKGVTIKIKKDKSSYLEQLKKDLSGSYTIDSATSDLPSSSAYDALVIIGE